MTPTLSLMTLVGILVLTGATLQLWIVWGAFTDSIGRGLLALFVPAYSLYYGWTRFSHPRRRWIVASMLAAFIAAGIGAALAMVVIAPHATMHEAALARDPLHHHTRDQM